ncbi:MAG TPA: prolyl oligopeptidase family serine peptidase [Niastella sp.]
MRKLFCIPALLLAGLHVTAQKKTLTHSVYDGWQSLNERYISSNGKWVVYTVTPQEGDATLIIQSTDNLYKKEIPRGYAAAITEDSRFVICKIRPFFAATRDARIKKKKPDDMPKDSLAIVELGKDSVQRIPGVKSFKTPGKGTGQWMAYLREKSLPAPAVALKPDSLSQLNSLLHLADSLTRVADSLRNKANEAKTKGLAALKSPKAAKPKSGEPVEEGTELILRNLYTGEEKKFPLVSDFYFSKPGNACVIETTRSNADTLLKATILWYNLSTAKADTVLRGFNDAKNLVVDEAGAQLAFIAERDSSTKALQKFYKLWYYRAGMDSARLRVDRNTNGVVKGLTVSESLLPEFSKDGQKLFFGLMPVRKPKDTTLVDFETARLDIWHYNDDYLQPQQLVQLNTELQRSFRAVLNGDDNKVIQLGAEDAENVTLVNEGDADYVLATSSRGNRKEYQWLGFIRFNAWIISTTDGSRKLVKEKQRGSFTISPKGRYVIWYDAKEKNYFTYAVQTGVITNITKSIKVPLYEEDDDQPDDPPAYGIMKWHDNDKYVYVYDKYDVWQCDPEGKTAPGSLTNGYGRLHKITYRYMSANREERFISDTQRVAFKILNEVTKEGGLTFHNMADTSFPGHGTNGKFQIGFQLLKAKDSNVFVFTIESYKFSPVLEILKDTLVEWADVDVNGSKIPYKDSVMIKPLYYSNPQQKDYNWLTAELVTWTMFDGKRSAGLLFKPEDFDAKKKYPIIFYFYEKNSDELYVYRPPAPSASTVNIPYFVSNGYLVFVPDIHYKNGEPGESAYNAVVSAAKYFTKKAWVDSSKMAIQGQSWGGYQVAYLITRTNIFAAAEAGAPVSNMTSAYGGIRWGTGLNRQFQYERSQSRIGYTLWQRPDLYIKNSPLFRAEKVNTPLLIMHNDADGAVPWYQGIEFFTALRRLGKKVWMLQYNGEDHNLVERKNRKDLSIRLSQYFDHFLKGAPAPRWLAEGLPATSKGIDWGTELEERKGF